MSNDRNYYMAKTKLFGNTIEPACLYCQHGRPAADRVMILCRKYGPVAPHYHCRKFIYDPLKRVPKRPKKMPGFTAEDFSLD